MRKIGFGYFLILIVLLGCTSNHTKDESPVSFWDSTFQLTPVVLDLEIPWDMVYDSQGYIWFTEKKGNIYRLKDRTWELELIHTFNDVFVSQIENSGLHSIMLHPNWPDSSYIYCHYAYSVDQSKLVRYLFDPQSSKLSEERDIFYPLHAARSHNGSRMTLDKYGCILFCIGDAYRFHPAQDIKDYSGKILRFNPDGSVPTDNPFNNHVWSYGHRNPQGLCHAENGILYSSEHGPGSDDELNIIIKAGNYGWPNG